MTAPKFFVTFIPINGKGQPSARPWHVYNSRTCELLAAYSTEAAAQRRRRRALQAARVAAANSAPLDRAPVASLPPMPEAPAGEVRL